MKAGSLVRALPLVCSSEVEMQSELDNPVGQRRGAADGAEASSALTGYCRVKARGRVGIWLSKLWIIGQGEEVRREDQAGVFSGRDPKILLKREIEVVYARVPHIGEEA